MNCLCSHVTRNPELSDTPVMSHGGPSGHMPLPHVFLPPRPQSGRLNLLPYFFPHQPHLHQALWIFSESLQFSLQEALQLLRPLD